MSARPGPKEPGKYQNVGPNYQKWGEQEWNGHVYNPATDTYYYDPMAEARWKAEAEKKLRDEYEEKPPKQPGIYEQAFAASVPALAATGAKYLFSKDGRDWLGGLLGIGTDKADLASKITPSALGSGLNNVGESFWDSIRDYGDEAWSAVSDFGEGAWDVGGDILGGIGDYASDAYDWLAGLF